MQKIILYYKFVPIEDTETIKFWQKTLCERLNLKGRIIISKHGINGTLGGDLMNLKLYTRAMKEHSKFNRITWKWSEGKVDHFPKLSVKVRKEIVTFGVPDELGVDDDGVVGGGKHLKPKQVHELVAKRGSEVVFMDGRNAYEAEIGRFKNAVIPNVRTTKDFIKQLEKPELAKLKDKPVVTYCTGGIRCEVLSALMKKRGFKEVYQMDGGIVKYTEEFKDDGLWEGKLYVFDKRMKFGFSDNSKDIGNCTKCRGKTSNYVNCANRACNDLILICQECYNKTQTCSANCAKLAKAQLQKA